MSIAELFLIAVGLSMDAFAVSVCNGLSMKKATVKNSTIVGLYFGLFQAGMPLLGYIVGTGFADKITAIDHWVAFILLSFIGIKMIKESREESCEITKDDDCLKPRKMIPMAIATSIDALAVGISFALINVKIIPAVTLIGVITFALSFVGVMAGSSFGMRFKSKAELAGGVILILMGTKILLEHTGIL